MSGAKRTSDEHVRRAAEILARRLRAGARPGMSYVVFDQQEGAIVVEAVKAKTGRAESANKTTGALRKPRPRRGTAPVADQRRRMIAEAAYYRALARGFEAGHELEDWLAAERELGPG